MRSPKLVDLADALSQEAWSSLARKGVKKADPSRKRRARKERFKQRIVEERGFKDVRTAREWVAEFQYRPTACDRDYRIVVLRKDLETFQGQGLLFENRKYFFYITNDRQASARGIVAEANWRCNQENVIQQHKPDVRSLTAPVNTFDGNWAYMVIASLAWSLKAWAALLLKEGGRWGHERKEVKRRLLRMDFTTFRHALINIPARIARTGRTLVYRLLAWNSWQAVFLRLAEEINTPLRC